MALLALVAAWVSVACTDDVPDPSAPTTSEAAREPQVVEEAPNPVVALGGAFDPPTLEVSVGDTVTWINDPIETEDHWVVSDGQGPIDSATLQPGNSYSHTFDEPGTFPYFCRIHPEMSGEVVVGSRSEAPAS